MKRLPARELALICAPLSLIAGAVLIPILRHPPKNPDAVIALSLVPRLLRYDVGTQEPRLQFSWDATARGGPKYGYRLGYRQQLVAVSKGGETVIYS